jgi:hypothetical protein
MVLFVWCAGPDPFSPFRLPQSEKIAVPKVSYGLMPAESDICVQELSRKTLGQRYLPATVSVSHLTPRFQAVSDMGRSSVLSLVDVLFSCAILVSLVDQLLGSDTPLSHCATCLWDTSALLSRYVHRLGLLSSPDKRYHKGVPFPAPSVAMSCIHRIKLIRTYQ